MEEVTFLGSLIFRDRQIASPVDWCYAIEIFLVTKSRNHYQNTLEVDSRKNATDHFVRLSTELG